MSDKAERKRRVRIPPSAMDSIFKEGAIIVEGLPDDAEFHNLYHDTGTGMCVAIYSSEEFEPIEEGEVIPETEEIVACQLDEKTYKRLRRRVINDGE